MPLKDASNSARGDDLRYDLELELSEAYYGKQIKITIEGRTIVVNIPRGVEDGTRLRLAGEGARGAPNGDLYIFVSVMPDSIFRREGVNLRRNVNISQGVAKYGGKIEVVTLSQKTLSVKVPQGFISGTPLRVRGYGMPILASGRFGDLILDGRIGEANDERVHRISSERTKSHDSMSKPMIVVSYRRNDTKLIVGRIVERLVAHFGKESVFLDIEDMPLGADFRAHIELMLAKCDILLALVGPQWKGTEQDGRKSRIFEENDWVRVEIEIALKRNIPIIPILVDRTPMPDPESLPSSIQPFAFRHAVELDPGRDFDGHMRRLLRGMDRLLGNKRMVG
jgi:hypothetical protein